VNGLPVGVSVSPTSITLTPGTPQQISLSAAANVATATQTVTFTGTSGSLTHTTQLSLSLNAFTGLPTRTRYVRTDATTNYFLSNNQHWIVYDTSTARYFVTDTSSNQVIVVDAASEKTIARIMVPQAFGIDETPDHSLLYVGTMIGDVYTIDPVAMNVTNHYLASQIGPYGFFANTALALADGQVALAGGPSRPSLGQPVSIAVWNPADNSIVNYGDNGPNPVLPFPCPIDPLPIQGVALSADRTQIILGASGLCEMNPTTGTGTYATAPLASVALYHIVVTPDGKYVVLANDTLSQAVATVLDANTLALVSQFNVLGDTSSGSGFFVSPDSTTLFAPTESIIYAYDLATQQLIGWAPNIFVRPFFVGAAQALGPADNPYFLATDGTGLFVGPLGEGIGFVDLSALQTGAVGTQFMDASLTPATGPTSGGTETQWSDEGPIGTLTSIDIGSQPASSISATAGSFGLVSIDATTPAGSAGPADVYVFAADGGMQLLPEAFSYGPTILEVTPNMATAEGTGTGYIYGYGFGPTNSDTIPAGVQVTVAGVPAQVTGFDPNAYGLSYPPFPLQSISYTIPPNVTGSVADVSVSTNSGNNAESGALSYLPPVQQFPLTGSTLAQGIYDSYTSLYYFTDTSQLQVFSRTQGKWLSPISIPPPTGATQQRLWGIALSPDGSKMAVSDLENGSIYVLSNFDNASPTIQTFSVRSLSDFNFLVNPCGLAISDSGNVYFMVMVVPGQGSGADQFFKLDTTNGTFFNYGINSPGLPTDAYLRNAISSDNSRVFFNDLGYIFYVDTATDKLVPANIFFVCCYLNLGNYDLALSSDQGHFEATGYFYDFNLNAESLNALNDREILNIAYVYGAKLSADGRLFFQPSTNGIDIFDGYLGNLLNRISLPVALSPNYDALVDDGTDNILVAITGTGNGIAVVDLTSISEPPPLPYTYRSGLRQGSSPRQFDARGSVNPQRRQPSHTVPHVTTSILLHAK
jgi:sugar lactone lactonase YvrE